MRKSALLDAARFAIYAALLLLAVFAQCGILPYFRIFGVIPNLTLAAVVAFSVFESPYRICIAAVAVGFLLDTVGGAELTASPVIMLLAASLGILFSTRIMKRGFLAAISAGAIASLADSLFFALALTVRAGAKPLTVLFYEALPSFLYTFFAVLAMYAVARLVSRIFGAHEASVIGY